MNIRQFVLLSLAAAIVGGTIGVQAAFANGQDTCPDGDGWVKIDSGDLSLYPVDGAVEYCFKAGTWVVDAIPEGGFGQEGSCNDGPAYCQLSHWAYRLEPDPTDPAPPEPDPTDVLPPGDPTPEPTPDPTEPRPTILPPTIVVETPPPTEGPEPTATPTDDVTPTDPPPPTPTELPNTGAVLLPNDVSPMEWGPTYWQEDDLPANLLLTHQGTDSGLGAQVVMLERGDSWSIGATDYEVVGTVRVEARDVWMLDFVAAHGDTVIMTCSGYNPVGGFWAYRVIVLLEELPR